MCGGGVTRRKCRRLYYDGKVRIYYIFIIIISLVIRNKTIIREYLSRPLRHPPSNLFRLHHQSHHACTMHIIGIIILYLSTSVGWMKNSVYCTPFLTKIPPIETNHQKMIIFLLFFLLFLHTLSTVCTVPPSTFLLTHTYSTS